MDPSASCRAGSARKFNFNFGGCLTHGFFERCVETLFCTRTYGVHLKPLFPWVAMQSTAGVAASYLHFDSGFALGGGLFLSSVSMCFF